MDQLEDHSKEGPVVISKKKPYDIDKIINNCSKSDGKLLMQYIAKTLNEFNYDLLYDLYKELGKDYMVGLFEKTLRIENDGGMVKKNPNDKDIMRTPGGIFFHLIRSNEIHNKIIKNIFRTNQKKLNQSKKLLKKLSKISI